MTPKFKRFAILAVLLLSGCGQKGPLFIPEPERTDESILGEEEATDTDKETAKKDG